MSDVAVREAGRDDVAQLAAWNAQLIADERNDEAQSAGELALRWREWLAAEYRACIFDFDRDSCGYALFRDLAECTHLRHFFVDAAHRRRGVGSRAFAQLRRDWFPRDKRVLVEVLVWNTQAIAFWKHVGFEERYLGLTLNVAERDFARRKG